MRLYVPATLDLLGRWHKAGEVRPPTPVCSARSRRPTTPRRGSTPPSCRRPTSPQSCCAGPGRRVVLVVESRSPSDAARSRDWQAVHADVADRAEGADPDEDLGWFATQEIPDLIG